MEKGNAQNPSPMSRTCQSCANSKVRCVRTAGQQSCNRCHRLGKECVNRQAHRRFYGFQKDLKIEALESKVNELMGTIAASSFKDTNGDALDARGNTPRSETDVGGIIDEDVIDRGFLTMETAEMFLNIFKTAMTEYFPFVVIPAHVTAEQLRREKPFIFLAVLASSSHTDMRLQRKLGREVKKAVAARIIIKGEQSFDLLQGLLVYLAWMHYHTRPHRYTQFLQLAISLVIELRLDRPPKTNTWKTGIRFKPSHRQGGDTFVRPSWGRDEQRAVAGCYYLSSTVAVLLQKKSYIPQLPYLEEWCKSLHDAAEYPDDRHILYLIQLQFIAEKIDRLSLQHGLELSIPGSASELYIGSLKSELDVFRNQLPFEMRKAPILAMQFHVTEICLYQLSLLDQGEDVHTGPSRSWKNEMLYAGRVASEAMLNVYLALPPFVETAFNNTQWVQLGFGLLVACKLVAMASKAGGTADRHQLKTSWTSTLTHLHTRVEGLSTPHIDSNGDRDVFSNFAERAAAMHSWLDEQFTQDDAPVTALGTASYLEGLQSAQADPALDFEAESLDGNFAPFEELGFTNEMLNDYLSPHGFHFSDMAGQMMNDWI